jgi:hypothetical protein
LAGKKVPDAKSAMPEIPAQVPSTPQSRSGHWVPQLLWSNLGDELFSWFLLHAAFFADQFRHLVTAKELGPPQCGGVMPVVAKVRIGAGIEQQPGYLDGAARMAVMAGKGFWRWYDRGARVDFGATLVRWSLIGNLGFLVSEVLP